MSRLLREQLFFLQFIQNSSKQQLKLVLNKITPIQVKVLSEIAINIIAGNIIPHYERSIPISFIKYIANKTKFANKKSKIGRNTVYVKRMVEGVYPTLKLLYG
jgi:hypothetical protein